MATLDDKLLGEKTHYYCSSSEDEREEDGEENKKESSNSQNFIPENDIDTGEYGATRTGPKGVIEDWRRFKQLETEKRFEQEAERKALAEKLAMTCRSQLDDKKAKADEELEQLELESMLEDEFMRRYREERMKQLIDNMHKNRPHFGKLFNLSKEGFVDAIDKENKNVTVIIHIEDQMIAACQAMNGCLQCLATEYPYVKFGTVSADAIQTSQLFTQKGLPALLIYKGGHLIGNFVRVSDQFGDDFFATDVESFLQEHGLLPNKEEMKVIKGQQEAADEDSDLDLD